MQQVRGKDGTVRVTDDGAQGAVIVVSRPVVMLPREFVTIVVTSDLGALTLEATRHLDGGRVVLAEPSAAQLAVMPLGFWDALEAQGTMFDSLDALYAAIFAAGCLDGPY